MLQRVSNGTREGVVSVSHWSTPLATSTAGSELCYRSLFASAAEPVLIVAALSEMVVEANPAAARLMGTDRSALVGMPFIDAFETSSAELLRRSLAIARAAGRASAIAVRVRNLRAPVGLKISLFRDAPDSYLLVRLREQPAQRRARASDPSDSAVLRAIEGASIGFLLTDVDLRVEYANPAFIEMLGLRSAEQVCGKSLAGWLELSAADLARLNQRLLQRRAATLPRVKLQCTAGGSPWVEVHAVAVPDGRDTRWGFTLRRGPRLN
jgi:PAS domain S-box-containing protein